MNQQKKKKSRTKTPKKGCTVYALNLSFCYSLINRPLFSPLTPSKWHGTMILLYYLSNSQTWAVLGLLILTLTEWSNGGRK